MSARSLNIKGPPCQGNITVCNYKNLQGRVGLTHILLHGNKICDIDYEEKEVMLSSCGWRTNTTKTAINNVLGQLGLRNRIYQKDHVWYITMGYDGINNEIVDDNFKDNLTLKF